jgi:hypothetical protein
MLYEISSKNFIKVCESLKRFSNVTFLFLTTISKFLLVSKILFVSFLLLNAFSIFLLLIKMLEFSYEITEKACF